MSLEAISRAERLCLLCNTINIEDISKPEGFTLHPNLTALRQCARNCTLCRLAINSVNDEENVQAGVVTGDEEWLDPVHWDQYKISLTWLKEGNDDYVAFELFPSDFDARDLTRHQYRAYGIIVLGGLGILTVPGDPAAGYGVPFVKALPSSTKSVETLNMATEWLDDCLLNHTGCYPPERSPGEGLSRLLEIRGNDIADIRLIRNDDPTVRYAALSYKWGTEPAVWRTIKSNLHERQLGFSVKLLPATLHDAIDVAVTLGLRHIWIDSICIVQDDDEDWKAEAAKMGAVYNGAHITIAGASSSGSNAGLYNERSISHMDTMEEPYCIRNILSTGERSSLFLSHAQTNGQWSDMVDRSSLSERGWCCQERLLSQRILHFAETQLFWECRQSHLNEDGYHSINMPRRKRGIPEFFRGYRPQPERILSDYNRWGFMGLETLTRSLISIWYTEIVGGDYSHRKLTNGSDKLIAMSGVAQMVSQVKPMGYLAGVWKEGLLFGLCWYRKGQGGKAPTYRAPSWSWASQESGISFRWLGTSARVSPDHFAQVLDAQVDTENGNEFGLVLDGWVRLKAKAMPVTIASEEMVTVDQDVGSKTYGQELSSRKILMASNAEGKAYLDDRMDQREEAIALLLMQPPQHVLFLLVRKLGTSDEFVRIGFAEVSWKNAEQSLKDFESLPHQKFVIK